MQNDNISSRLRKAMQEKTERIYQKEFPYILRRIFSFYTKKIAKNFLGLEMQARHGVENDRILSRKRNETWENKLKLEKYNLFTRK